MLEVSELMRRPDLLAQKREGLARLEKAYRERSSYWSKSALDDDLKRNLRGNAGKAADEFWHEVNSVLLPAIEQRDMPLAEAAYARAAAAFDIHRGAIEGLTLEGIQRSTDAGSDAIRTTNWTLAGLGLLNLLAMGFVALGLRLLLSKAFDPLLAVAKTMRAMADGDMESGRCDDHRPDEVGDMTSAVELFRETALRQRRAEQDQALVVAEISSGLEALASGNLTHRITAPFGGSFESLRASFNRSGDTLAQLLRDVSRSADRVLTGAREIGAASTDLAARNGHQAAHVENTLVAMNEVAVLVSGTAESAARAQSSVEDAHRQASESGRIVANATAAMAAIATSSSQISQIVSLIDGIAFQTNLLALNAGVEAARAGNAGQGFAVVASEVRSLAQRSAQAAAEIGDLIAISGKQVETGVGLVNLTGEALEHIQARVTAVKRQIDEITAGTVHQSDAIAQINVAAKDMDKVTQQNAAMAEESDAAAHNLAGEANELNRLVSQFHVDGARQYPHQIERAAA